NDLLQDRYATFLYSRRQGEIAGRDGELRFNEIFGQEARVVIVLHRGEWGQTTWDGVLGFSMGGVSALTAAENGGIEHLSPRKFRVVIAYYPYCEVARTMSVPTLVLIGALDDWTPAQACQELAERGANDGAPIELVVYPNAYHGFDVAILRPGLRYF